MTAMRMFLVAITTTFLGVACAPDESCLEKSCRDKRAAEEAATADAGAQTGTVVAALPACTVFGKPHIGLGGIDIAASSEGAPAGDRARIKPYSALVSEYRRVLGKDNAPVSIQSTGNTFGVANERWFLEPLASAVLVNAAFDVGFEGCGKLTAGDARFATMPTKETAHDVCIEWTRRFWSREATPEQLDACAEVALEASETVSGPPATPQRRWSYACASVLTATGFLTY